LPLWLVESQRKLSGWQDLNLRHLAPKASALAKLSYTPLTNCDSTHSPDKNLAELDFCWCGSWGEPAGICLRITRACVRDCQIGKLKK